jgi:hypothetical protein
VAGQRPGGREGAGEDGGNGNDHGDKEPARKKKRGPVALTALTAPPGHVKMFFVESHRADRMICLLCQAKHPEDRDKWLVAQGDGTHNCKSHMKSTHGLDMQGLSGGAGQMTLPSGMKFSKEAVDASLLTEMIIDLLPFTFAQRPGRRASMEQLVPKSYTPPSRTWFVQALKAEYLEGRSLMTKALKCDRFCHKFSLSFDGWRAAIQA